MRTKSGLKQSERSVIRIKYKILHQENQPENYARLWREFCRPHTVGLYYLAYKENPLTDGADFSPNN